MDERIWEGLLSTALAILDDLDDTQDLDAPEDVMGGGTMPCLHQSLNNEIDLSSTTLNGSLA